VTDFVVQRIIIACDAVSENRAGMEAAARLARSWNALLHAVFVQDESLLNLAALPFARQMGSAGLEKLDETTMLRQLETDTARARAALEAVARSYAVASSFAVVRGQPTLAALSVGDRDLVVISATARPFAGQFRLASRWLTTALEAHLPVLLIHNRAEWDGGIVCAIEAAGPSSWRTLTAAGELALTGNRPLVVRIAGDAAAPNAVRKWLERISPELARTARVESMRRGQRLDEDRGSLLVIDAASGVRDLAALKALAERSQADVLFVR